ncbi:hypothetical protein R3I94_017389 [Phoxinus phoxinus]
MAVRRMNELWKTMALALMFGFLLLHSCQGQETHTTDATKDPGTTSDQALVPSTVLVPNTASVTPTSSTTEPEVKAQTTLEPNKPSSSYTTHHNTLSETNASDNSKSAIFTTFPSTQPETAAPKNNVKEITETVKRASNPASNQESRQSELDMTTEDNGASGSSPAVFVSVLVTGLLVAAIIIGIYYFKCHRQTNGKGMKLAEESYMADEENQGNTLVSVAPLNQPEPQEKPSLNGESQEAVKPQTPPAATNGHSTTKTADTEL